MANKNITRVEKRYVPQQESYRNLPGLRPAAEPVVAAETPAPSGEGEKLRQWGEALASGNSALKDFFTMEKSFEETNRLANKTNAILGLPPVPGQGHLDYGVDYGYQEGLGRSKSITLSEDMERQLLENNYFVNPDSPEDTIAKVNEFTHKFLSDNLDPYRQNRAFLEGASTELAKTKIKAVSTASAMVSEERVKRQLNNEASIFQRTLKDLPEDLWRSPEGLRGAYNSAIIEATKRGLGRTAASSLFLKVAGESLTAEFSVAQDSGDLVGQQRAISKLKSLSQSANLKDNGGQPLGAFVKTADGTVTRALGEEMSTLRSQINQFTASYDKSLESAKEDLVDNTIGNAIGKLYTKEWDIGKATDSMQKLRTLDPKGYREAMDYMYTFGKNERDIDDTQYRRDLLASGNYDLNSLKMDKAAGRLTTSSANELATDYLRTKSESESAVRHLANHLGVQDRTQRLQRETLKKANFSVLSLVTSDPSITPATATKLHTWVSNMTTAGQEVSIEALDTLNKSFTDITNRRAIDKVRVATDTAATAARTTEAVKTMASVYTKLDQAQQGTYKRAISGMSEEAKVAYDAEITSGIAAAEEASRRLMPSLAQQAEYKRTTNPDFVRRFEHQEELARLEALIRNPLTPLSAKQLAVQRRKELNTYVK